MVKAITTNNTVKENPISSDAKKLPLHLWNSGDC